MADIRFRCRNCDHKLVVEESAAGFEIRCPVCGATQTVPISESAPAPTATAEPVPAVPEFAARESEPTGGEEFKYVAFISYRHVEPDRTWAQWLHTQLETYRVPKRLVKERTLPSRLQKVFRDEEELPASADLSKEIERALNQSRFLIVVCSPRTPSSNWVDAEVQHFRNLGRHNQILALLIEGEPGESFPRSLREIRRTIADRGGLSWEQQIEEVEPLAADVRGLRHERPRQIRRMAKLRMLACILGVPFDDLRQREQERRRRRIAVIGSLAAVALVAWVATVTGLLVKVTKERNRTEAERRRAEVERDRAEETLRKLQAAQEAERVATAEADHAKTAAGIYGRWQEINRTNSYMEFFGDGNIVVFSKGGEQLAGKYKFLEGGEIKVDFGAKRGMLNLKVTINSEMVMVLTDPNGETATIFSKPSGLSDPRISLDGQRGILEGLDDGKRAALKEALCFSGSKSDIIGGLMRLGEDPALQESRLKSAVGTNNLSVFLLVAPSSISKQLQECDWQDMTPDMVRNAKLQWRIQVGGSFFMPEDVRDLKWVDLGADKAEGSFRIETDWMFKGRCLFKAKKQNETWRVTGLAIAKKGSSRFSDGVVVFDLDEPLVGSLGHLSKSDSSSGRKK